MRMKFLLAIAFLFISVFSRFSAGAGAAAADITGVPKNPRGQF